MIRALLRGVLTANPALDGLFRRYFWSRVHFPEMELKLLHALPAGAIDHAVDVGAALGGYAWVMGRKARGILCYEPGLFHGDYLATVTAGTKVTLVRAAVGAAAGELELFTPGDDNDARHMATLSRNNPVATMPGTIARRVPVVTLDEDVPVRLGREARIDVLKIDVEGFENAVLAGAHRLIADHHPLVIAEIEARHNPDYRTAFAQLREAGYDVHFWREGRYHLLAGDDIAPLQKADDLVERLRPGHNAAANEYINNFVFQHPLTRIRLA